MAKVGCPKVFEMARFTNSQLANEIDIREVERTNMAEIMSISDPRKRDLIRLNSFIMLKESIRIKALVTLETS
jgi:hypothetical protein